MAKRSNLDELKRLDEEGKANTLEAQAIALEVYEHGLPMHQCYWNDRLYIALRFGLDEQHQKRAIVNSVISNGRSGYFEQTTHFGFDNRKLLQEQGIPLELLPEEEKPYLDYQELDERVIEIVTKKFGVDLNNRKELERLAGDYYHSQGYGKRGM